MVSRCPPHLWCFYCDTCRIRTHIPCVWVRTNYQEEATGVCQALPWKWESAGRKANALATLKPTEEGTRLKIHTNKADCWRSATTNSQRNEHVVTKQRLMERGWVRSEERNDSSNTSWLMMMIRVLSTIPWAMHWNHILIKTICHHWRPSWKALSSDWGFPL